MTAHREIMVAAATAVKDSSAILAYCKTHFSRGIEIVIGAYPGTEDRGGIPSEDDSPFLWIYATGENESVAADNVFTMHAVVGGCVRADDGAQILTNVVAARGLDANGLIVNGGNKVVEDLRDMIMLVVRDTHPGAIIQRMRRTENDLSHYPLEWAEFEVDLVQLTTLNQED